MLFENSNPKVFVKFKCFFFYKNNLQISEVQEIKTSHEIRTKKSSMLFPQS